MTLNGTVIKLRMVVTGATGFLGKKLSYRLKDMGHDVVGLGRNNKIGLKLKEKGIDFKKIDLSNEMDTETAIQNADFVFHCAALSSPWGKYEEFYKSNVIATKNVINACKKNEVKRLIHVSTPSIYFHFDERLNVKESDSLPSKKVNFYAETKYLAEKEIDKAFEEGLSVITIRPRALFGPEDTTIIPRLIKTNDEKFIPMINGGNVLMDLTYVENVVDSLLLCMDSPKSTLGKKYNITNGETVYLNEILDNLFEILGKNFNKRNVPYFLAFKLATLMEWVAKVFLGGKEPTLTKYTVSVLSKSQTLNIDAAVKELGYKPKVSIKEGIKLFADWWKQNENN